MDLAKELNDALFELGSDPDAKCTRIAFKSSEGFNKPERDMGGMCKQSSEEWFRETLDKLLRRQGNAGESME